MSANPTTSFPLGAYLARIDVQRADLDGLGPLQVAEVVSTAQYRAVPFENLGIHAGRIVDPDPAAVVERLIHRRHGGICYEVNGLLAAALRALGVDVRLLGARVDPGSGAGFGRARAHVALVLPSGGPVLDLIDVGFGGELIRTRIDVRTVAGLCVRLGEARYLLNPRPLEPADFTAMARWHSADPQARFTGSVICTLPTADGRRTLTARPASDSGELAYRLITVDGGRRSEESIQPEEADLLLEKIFRLPGRQVPRYSAVAAAHR